MARDKRLKKGHGGLDTGQSEDPMHRRPALTRRADKTANRIRLGAHRPREHVIASLPMNLANAASVFELCIRTQLGR